ncbi:hypothetical protein A2U01_0084638, partial [Trifolium medium]|nr:hypothetical protein [Trifolium medium]
MPTGLAKSLPRRSPRSSSYSFMLSSVFTSTAALLNLSRYDLKVSSSLYTIASSAASVFGWRLEAVKCAV